MKKHFSEQALPLIAVIGGAIGFLLRLALYTLEESTGLLPRELYYEKIAAAIEALKGTDCMLIARTNADPKTQLEEGCILQEVVIDGEAWYQVVKN